MKFILKMCSLILAVAVIQLLQAPLGEAQFVPTRCMCVKSETIFRRRFTNFTVIEKGSHCKNTEIILTLDKSGHQVCLSPDGQRGQRLLKCWNRINKDESKKKKCIRRRQKKVTEKGNKESNSRNIVNPQLSHD
ncbi:C-X-C motif chemokine 3 [Amia ocellicauda]|uniref:C-X-C motif chemokine 3 n=1 Tax=Amia ocellicauda TaxID=2972642 RepID=UPI0034646F4C